MARRIDAPPSASKATTRRRTGRGGMHDPAVVDIDPKMQWDEDDLPLPQSRPKSPWTLQLEQLIELVESGDVELGKFIQIGEFRSEQGAQQRGSKMHELEPRLREFAFDYRWKTMDSPLAVGKKWSVLYARLVPTAEGGE